MMNTLQKAYHGLIWEIKTQRILFLQLVLLVIVIFTFGSHLSAQKLFYHKGEFNYNSRFYDPFELEFALDLVPSESIMLQKIQNTLKSKKTWKTVTIVSGVTSGIVILSIRSKSQKPSFKNFVDSYALLGVSVFTVSGFVVSSVVFLAKTSSLAEQISKFTSTVNNNRVENSKIWVDFGATNSGVGVTFNF